MQSILLKRNNVCFYLCEKCLLIHVKTVFPVPRTCIFSSIFLFLILLPNFFLFQRCLCLAYEDVIGHLSQEEGNYEYHLTFSEGCQQTSKQVGLF